MSRYWGNGVPVSAMNPAAWAIASGRSPSSSASRPASARASPGILRPNSSTDSAGEHLYLDWRRDLVPAVLARGDEYVPAVSRQPRCDIRRRLSVVEDQQPPAATTQLGQYRGPYRLAFSPSRNAPKRLAKAGDLIRDE